MYTDSHAHLTSDDLFENIEAILSEALEVGVDKIVNICTDVKTLKRGIELSSKFPWVYNTASITPHEVDKKGDHEFPFIAECARSGQLKAVGETGLDYHYEHSDRATQKRFLIKYLQLALECNLPVVIHCREAFDDFFEILDTEYQVNGQHAPGVLHCFTGTLSEAEEVLKRGWMLSLSGIVTFKKSHDLQQVARMVPLSQLLIETDAPFLAPQSRRGKPNQPAYLLETAAFIARLKGVPVEEIAFCTAQNARRLFDL
jgi:TatD DNase family protein